MLYIGELSALLTALLWSFTSFAFSAAAKRAGSIQTNINRMIMASVFLVSTILLFNFNYNLSKYQVINLVISGIIGLILGDSFLFRAFQLIGARTSMLLMALSPAMSALLAYIFLKEDLSAAGILGMIVTITGIALVVLEKSPDNGKRFNINKAGLLYGFLGALGQAAGLIFAKFAFQESDVNKVVATFIRVFSSVIIMLPVLMIIKKYKNPVRLYKSDTKAFFATLTGTILGPYLGITFSLIAIDNTKVGIAATLMSTMPIIMLPISKYIFKETLNWRSIIGALFAVGGIAILFLR
jgi:drug/metabolite transporter (DMT)-like permease